MVALGWGWREPQESASNKQGALNQPREFTPTPSLHWQIPPYPSVSNSNISTLDKVFTNSSCVSEAKTMLL